MLCWLLRKCVATHRVESKSRYGSDAVYSLVFFSVTKTKDAPLKKTPSILFLSLPMTPITSKIRSSVLPCWAVSAVRMRPQKNSPTSHFFAGRQLGFGIGSELNTPTKVMLYLINKTKVNALNFHRSPSERKWIEPLNHPPLSSSLPNMDLAEDSAPNIAGLSSVSPHSSRHFGANVTFF